VRVSTCTGLSRDYLDNLSGFSCNYGPISIYIYTKRGRPLAGCQSAFYTAFHRQSHDVCRLTAIKTEPCEPQWPDTWRPFAHQCPFNLSIIASMERSFKHVQWSHVRWNCVTSHNLTRHSTVRFFDLYYLIDCM